MIKNILSILIFTLSSMTAQDKSKPEFTGNLHLDSKLAYQKISTEVISEPENFTNTEKKSPILAGLLSFVLPGAGEYYSESYLKSAIFLVIEAAAITTAIIFDRKGNDQTSYFQDFANGHWNVVQYAKWTINHASQINSEVDPNDYNVIDNQGRVQWGELNRLENAIGNYYSHRLAPYGDQQYFEMIGKYPQFNPGWDDFGDENTPFDYGNPLTNNFIFYSGERGKANDFYNIAAKAIIAIIVNHALSAADAAWSASRYNNRLSIQVGLERENFGSHYALYPQLKLRYQF